MYTGLVSERHEAVNLLTGPTHSRTPQKQTFILCFHHSDIDRAGTCPF